LSQTCKQNPEQFIVSSRPLSELWTDLSLERVPYHSAPMGTLSIKKRLFPRITRSKHLLQWVYFLYRAVRLPCKEFYAAFLRIRWSFGRQSYWSIAECQDCFRFRPTPGELHLFGKDMLQCSEDIQLVMSLHPWATAAEKHLIQIAWYLGAEWALNSPHNVDDKSESYRVF
jgi:hypothetical protein